MDPKLTLGIISAFALVSVALAGPPDDTRRLAEIHCTHFLWIVPPQNGTQAKLFYSDDLKKSNDSFALHELDEIVGPLRIYARDYENESAPLKLLGSKNGYTLPVPGKELEAITGKTFPLVTAVCLWRVFDDAKDGPYLLSYTASFLSHPRLTVKAWDRLAFEVLPNLGNAGTIISAKLNGKSLRNVEVEILAPEQEKPLRLSTGEQGFFIFENAFRAALKPGLYGIRVRHVEMREGKHHDRAFKQVNHFATLAMWVGKDAP